MPDYSSPEYWLSRFQKETHFEWLGSGHIISLHVARAFGRTLSEDGTWSPDPSGENATTPRPTKILHIGSGTSKISLHLRSLVLAPIVNIDFVENCLTQLRQFELNAFGNVKMGYEQLDMLDWEQVEAQLRGKEGEETVLIIDKSTSDAISCGPDRPSPFSSCLIPPVKVLAFNLAALSSPGSIWLALSYSTSRFDEIGELWNIEERVKIPVTGGQQKEGVWAPEVWHTLFVLRRTDASLPSIVYK
ncbi:hypothetical protein OPQ81_002141 [Rhizoctonia solani]|nr:hypothetical protein OPQ81_002141 [Rhizoctonia solani]